MALFTDGPACTIQDLIDEDSGLLDTAQSVGINVTAKFRLAMDDLESDLENWLQKPLPAAVGPTWALSPSITQVVVTKELARWEKMQTLSMVYRDAYFSQLVDRYKGKWDEYVKLTHHARAQLVASGVGLVADPMPKAPLPVLAMVTVTSDTSAATYYVSVTWVNAEAQEGAPSDAASLAVIAGDAMTVTVPGAPMRATGFNVYVGTSLTSMPKQNETALPPDGTFTYLPGAFTGGGQPGTGQQPDYVRALPRTTMRG